MKPQHLGALQRALRAITPSDCLCGAQFIGDDSLLPGEAALLGNTLDVVDSVRRATATGRNLARQLLVDAGGAPALIGRGQGGRPLFPPGFTGSIAHDDAVAVCILGPASAAVGIDVEPALPLPAEILHDVVTSPAERALIGEPPLKANLLLARLLFCCKEAVYKACFPVDGVFLEFVDVDVQLDTERVVHHDNHNHGHIDSDDDVQGIRLGRFTTRSGHRGTLWTACHPRLLAVARNDVVDARSVASSLSNKPQGPE